MAEETTPTTNSAPAQAAGGVPEGIEPAVWELGKQSYALCSACHQPTGAGLPGAFPPLAESEWVNGPVENLIRIQLRGLNGPIEVKGQAFAGVMPPMAQQTDEQIAAVLTYVRNSWGNKASAVTPEMVAEFRGEVGQPMLTATELIDPKEAAAKAAEKADAPAADGEGGGNALTLAPAVVGEMPSGQTYNTFPNTFFALGFIAIVLLVAGKFVFSRGE